MKIKPATITITDEEGNVIEEILMSAADDNWLLAGRLAEKARAGDQQAA